MAGEEVDDLVTRAVHRLGDFGDASVQVAPLSPQHPRVSDVLNEGVVEDDPAVTVAIEGIEEPGGDEPFEGALQVRRVPDRLEQWHLDTASDHGGGLQDRGVGAREKVDSRGEQLLDRGRNPFGVPAGLRPPGPILAQEGTGLLERSQELLDEKRIAGRTLSNECGEPLLHIARQQTAN